jgi:hypothetical protein
MKNEDKKTTSRASQTREKTKRKQVWTPPSYLDTPNAPAGFRHRWVRVEIMGFLDTKNIQGRLRSGYELVRADEFPGDDYPAIPDGKYAGVIGHGGLVLTRVPTEIAKQRSDYFAKLGQEQMDAVDERLRQEEHKSMPIDIDRQSRTTFGGRKR